MAIGAAIAGALATAAANEALGANEGSPGRAQDITPEAFRRLRGPVADSLRGMIGSGGGPGFSGDFTAGLGSGEQEFLSLIRNQGRPSGLAGGARDLFSRTVGGEFLSPDSNPFLAATIEAAQRPLLQQFQDVTMPRLRSGFTQAGQFIQPEGSSPFDRAAALASRGLTQELGDVSTRIAGQNFQAERGRQQQAAAAVPAMDRAQLEKTMSALDAQALPRMIEQFGIDRGLEEFRRRSDTLLASLQAAAGISSPQPVQFAPIPGQPGILHGMAEAFAGGLARRENPFSFGGEE